MIDKSGLPDSVKASALSIFHRLGVCRSRSPRMCHRGGAFSRSGGGGCHSRHRGLLLVPRLSWHQQGRSIRVAPGHGFVDCRHGRLPLPAPATLSILKDIPVYGMAVEGELVTPTGAAIIATLGKTFGPIPAMSVSSIGYGAGHQEFSLSSQTCCGLSWGAPLLTAMVQRVTA